MQRTKPHKYRGNFSEVRKRGENDNFEYFVFELHSNLAPGHKISQETSFSSSLAVATFPRQEQQQKLRKKIRDTKHRGQRRRLGELRVRTSYLGLELRVTLNY